ncbi:MAG TPA: SDR family NAD(P)-dependent oxidoreductase [Candidatus Barnesiella excrementavium]|nr:SDR family NAD(P)-dependent oxidoreductase [Candidatus Barnesiella excrementavium]
MNKEYYIITGANGSIGQAITEELARQGLSIIMACRNLAKSQPVQQQIIEKTGNTDITLLPLDLASFASILEFANRLSQDSVAIQTLINNAGVMNQHYSQTADGFESTIGVNYIGTVLLTRLLLPLMHPGSRIVTTTSLTRYIGKIDESFFGGSPHDYKRFEAYSKSKLALTLYTARLAQELRPRGIWVNAADPGVVDTDMITMHSWVDPLANRFFRPFISTPQEGAAGAIFAATSPEAYGVTGEIFKKKKHTPIPPRVIHAPKALWLYEETGKRITEALSKQPAHEEKI